MGCLPKEYMLAASGVSFRNLFIIVAVMDLFTTEDAEFTEFLGF